MSRHTDTQRCGLLYTATARLPVLELGRCRFFKSVSVFVFWAVFLKSVSVSVSVFKISRYWVSVSVTDSALVGTANSYEEAKSLASLITLENSLHATSLQGCGGTSPQYRYSRAVIAGRDFWCNFAHPRLQAVFACARSHYTLSGTCFQTNSETPTVYRPTESTFRQSLKTFFFNQ